MIHVNEGKAMSIICKLAPLTGMGQKKKKTGGEQAKKTQKGEHVL